jgi:hypothetical protein
MKKILLLFVFHIVFTTFLFSQSDSTSYLFPKIITEGTTRYCNFSKLNNILIDNGFNEFSDDIFGISLGYWSYDLKKKSYSTFVFSLFLDQQNSVGNIKSSKLEIAEFAIQYHRIISNRPKWFIYPYLGLGSSLGRLTLSETVNKLDFEESVSDISIIETNTKKYFTNVPIVFANLGIGVDRKITFLSNDIFFGLTLGYKFSTKSDWGYANSPRMNLGGFEIAVRFRPEFSEKYINKLIN